MVIPVYSFWLYFSRSIVAFSTWLLLLASFGRNSKTWECLSVLYISRDSSNQPVDVVQHAELFTNFYFESLTDRQRREYQQLVTLDPTGIKSFPSNPMLLSSPKNKLLLIPNQGDCLSPKVIPHLGCTTLITLRRYKVCVNEVDGIFSIFKCPAKFSFLLASFLLPPSHFLVAYLFLIIVSPWYAMLWSLIERFFNCLLHTLSSLPTIFITWVNQNQENPEPAVATVEQIKGVEVGGNLMEHDLEQIEIHR